MLRESLEIQAVQQKKYLKCANDLEYSGHMLLILINNYKVIRHT